MKISGMDKSKLKILAACEEFSTTKEIAERIGIHHKTISQYLCGLGDYVIRAQGAKPWKFKRNPEKTFIPGEAEKINRRRIVDPTAPLLPQGPLSFIREYQRYTPPEGRKVEERHGGWIGRKEGGYMGNGSYAHVEMFGD